MLIFIPILIFVALVIVAAAVKIVPQGYQWTVGASGVLPRRCSRD